MRKAGYEVIATRPVCVDFRDGRSISFRPGMRFESIPSNPAVVRLLRVGEIRKLGTMERVPPLPVGFGAPRKKQAIMSARREVEAARIAAEQKMRASKAAPPKIEVAKPEPKRPASKKKD
jgi:hypothetical protein